MTKQTTRRQTAILLVLLVLLLVLHAPRLVLPSFWADECYTIGLTQLSLPQLAQTLSTNDAHPPLHDLLLTWAVRLFGTSPFVLQSVSLLAVLCLGVLGATWVRRRFGFRCAAAFLLLLMFTRSMIDYATEVRMYAWSMLFVTLCMAFAYELLHSDRVWLWVGLVGTALASAYAHYYGLVAVAFVILGLFVYRMWVLPWTVRHGGAGAAAGTVGVAVAVVQADVDAAVVRADVATRADAESTAAGDPEAEAAAAAAGGAANAATGSAAQPAAATRIHPIPSHGLRCLWRFCVAGLACAAGYAPWLSVLLSQLSDGMENWWMTQIPSLQSFLLFAFGWQATGYVLFFLACSLFAAYFLAAGRVSCSFSLADDGTQRMTWNKKALLCNTDAYFVACGVGVLGAVLCVGLGVSLLLRPTFLERYLFPSVGILLLALAVAVSRLPLRRNTLAVLAAVLVLTGALNYATTWRDERAFAQNTATAQAAINAKIAPGDTLLSDSDHLYWAVLPYYFPDAKTADIDDFEVRTAREDIANGKSIWLCDAGGAQQSALAQTLADEGLTATKVGDYTLHWYTFALYRIG